MRLAKPELDVGIVSSDAEATCAFYRDVMGFEEMPSMPLGKGAQQHRFQIGHHLVKINQFAQQPPRERGGTERAIGIRLLAFILDDLDAVLGRLDNAGRKHSTLPTGDELGYRVAFAKDPEGNVLELVGLRKPAGDTLTSRLQVGLTVASVERSRHFYGKQLGLREEPVMPLGADRAISERYGFVWGSTTIKFWSVKGAQLPIQTGAPMQRAGLRMFTAMVEDIDEAYSELVTRDVPVRMAPTELPGVARIMFVADPDDNWIELAQRI
jgi:catechol 2,3-dioxygenase-like lactoylglutathione lyase family enzyme